MLQNVSILRSESNVSIIVELRKFVFYHPNSEMFVSWGVYSTRKALRPRLGVDYMLALGMLSLHRLILRHLILLVEEPQALVESSNMLPLSMLRNNVNGHY